MPECQSCGNTSTFIHSARGDQVRVYDDDGTFVRVESENLATQTVHCNECGSRDVVWE